MSVGSNIARFRKRRNMTQKELGMAIGFSYNTADVRIAQYEKNARSPKQDITGKLATALGVVPEAITIPDIDSSIGVMHTLFALEDNLGLTVQVSDGLIQFSLSKSNVTDPELCTWLDEWSQKAAALNAEAISREAYDEWRETFESKKTENSQSEG